MNELGNPRVSVVIPTRNRASLLLRAVKSVLNQTFRDFELIIVDGGSSDGTREALEPFLRDPRVRYFFKENGGAGADRNFGIHHAVADYVALLDSDDEWLPEKLEKQMMIYEKNPTVDTVFCWLLRIDETAHYEHVMKVDTEGILKAGDAARAFLEYSAMNKWWSAPSEIVFRKSNGVLFDEKLRGVEDIDFTIQLLLKENFFCVREPLVRYYVHGANGSAPDTPEKKLKLAEYWEAVIKKNEDVIASSSYAYAAFLRGTGRCFLLAGKRTVAARYFLKAAKLRPLALKTYILLLATMLGRGFFSRLLAFKERYFVS